MKLRSAHFAVGAAMTVAAAIGLAIWALSPWATGHEEAFDVGYYYIPALFAGGFASAFLVGKPAWAHFVGSVMGQLLYLLLVLKVGWLVLPSLIFIPVASLLFFAGAYSAVAMRRHLHPLT